MFVNVYLCPVNRIMYINESYNIIMYNMCTKIQIWENYSGRLTFNPYMRSTSCIQCVNNLGTGKPTFAVLRGRVKSHSCVGIYARKYVRMCVNVCSRTLLL